MALQSVCGWDLTPLRRPLPRDLCPFPALTSSPSPHLLRPPRGLPPSRRNPSGPPPPSHGTTTLAFIHAGGVVAATDTRSSAGSLVCSPDSRKATCIHSHLLATTSGSAADCQLFGRALAKECRLYQLRNGYMPSVLGAARMLSAMMLPFRGTEICAAFTLCGWDPWRGPGLCYVYNDGTRLSADLLSVGSGSPYAFGVLDDGYRVGMGEDEARQLARRAVCHAGRRDAYSGGGVDVYWVREGGCERDPREDLGVLYERLKKGDEGREESEK
ncbi:proteasome subunit beta type-11 [Ascaphus truei]|uniref:proteasome subunit beta type-11 n=1 Tax=Ascaphus truei TaxID=8439 RepID=UPI003F5A463B